MSKIPEILCLRRYQLALVALAVLVVYYPALSAGFCLVDDFTMMHGINSSRFSWIEIFIPGSRFYYRPILNLSFRFDKWMWDFMPSFMHLENILLHLANTSLVYFIAERFFRPNKQHQPWGPLLAALLFGLHPLATESVNWISGRTDPLASLFVLLSVLALFQALATARYRWVLFASLSYMLGTLSKEVMVFFLPAAVVLLCLYPASSEKGVEEINRRRALAVFCLPLVLLLFVFLGIRVGMRGDTATGISDLVAGNRYAPWDLVRVYFKVTGFYIKKLFWPAPLNFAIVKISDLYVWLGLAAFGSLLYRVRRHCWHWVPWIMAGLLLTPSFFIAIADVTWAPLAERYAYLAAAFWSIGFVGIVVSLNPSMVRPSFGAVMLFFMLVGFTVVTAQRNYIWQDNFRLFSDTVAKSPSHIGVRNELGNVLFERGMIIEAKHQYAIGLSQASGVQQQLTFNMARVYLALDQPYQARQVLLDAMGGEDFSKTPLLFLKKLGQADAILFENAAKATEQKKYGLELLDVYEAVFAKVGEPVILFRGGQLAQRLGEPIRAASFFARAHAAAPPNAFFRRMAGQLANQLAHENASSLD